MSITPSQSASLKTEAEAHLGVARAYMLQADMATQGIPGTGMTPDQSRTADTFAAMATAHATLAGVLRSWS